MEVVFFPDNKLGATVEPIYNGHVAIVSQNTDRLKDNKFEKAEIELFRSDIQGTSFLNPRGAEIGENSNYKDLIGRVSGTGRVSFGMYYNTDAWISPVTNNYQVIPDYYSATWTSAGVSVFNNAVLGASKPLRYPNHGQQMYDISSGDYGVDLVTGTIGASNLKESSDWTERQLSELYFVSGKRITSISYMNGANAMSPILVPFFLLGRNSIYSWSGNTDVSYQSLSRQYLINKPSNTRTWDAVRESRFVTQTDSLNYTKTQIRLAIDNNGMFSDFMHWHSLYEIGVGDLPFFKTLYEGFRDEIGLDDVWLAGNNEAAEYYFIRESIRSIGSFEDSGKVYIFYEVFDKFKDVLNGISQDLDCALLDTPVSIRINLTGTALAGKNIKCDMAKSIRSLGSNVYIINLPYHLSTEGFTAFEVSESTTPDYYSSVRPTITRSGNTITTDINSKLVIWRKATGSDDKTIREVYRNNVLSTSFNYTFDSGYSYCIGAISKYRHSSLIEV